MKILRDFPNAFLEPVCANFNITTARYTYRNIRTQFAHFPDAECVWEDVLCLHKRSNLCKYKRILEQRKLQLCLSQSTASTTSSLVFTRNSFGTLGVFVLFRILRFLIICIMDHKSYTGWIYACICALRCSRIHCAAQHYILHNHARFEIAIQGAGSIPILPVLLWFYSSDLLYLSLSLSLSI